MNTDRLLKLVHECVEHEYAPYIGGASFLTGAVVWFYATDISRVLKVSQPGHPVNNFFLICDLAFLALRVSSRLPEKVGQGADSRSTGGHSYHTVHRWVRVPSRSPHGFLTTANLQSPRMVTEYRQKYGPLYRVFCGDIPEV